MTFNYLLVDMNSYFASVEQQNRPELRGRPVGVVSMLVDTTCCIAASYEAKACGVKTGTLVRDARRLCPEIQFVEARTTLYVATHHKIVEAVDSCLPVTQVLSIDEMVCELKGPDREPDAALTICRDIKTAIRQRVGTHLKCSIGLGPNRLLAKLAADWQKPDGLTTIRREELPERLFSLKLTDFSGIGRRMEARLRKSGITTVEQFCRLSKSEMTRIWGSELIGRSWWQRLRGEDVPDPRTHRHSVGHSHVLPPARRNPAAARAIVIRLLHKAAARLRHIGYWTGSLTLSVSYLGRDGWHERVKVTPCQDTLSLIRDLGPLWDRRPKGKLLKVGVVLGDLVPQYEIAPSLFEDDRKLTTLAHIMDQLNGRFGDNAVFFGGMHGAEEAAPTRIAFNHIPDIPMQELADAEEESLDE
ncbi:MAG: DNA polymerase [Planctomycetota bacterium]